LLLVAVGGRPKRGSTLPSKRVIAWMRLPVRVSTSRLPLDGYTLVTAGDFAAAVELAKGCPIVEEGGGVEVGLLTPVPGREHPARIF
jgi:hypothetical protein